MAGGLVSSPKSNEPFVLRHHKYALLYCSFFVLGAVLYGYDGTCDCPGYAKLTLINYHF
jgi:MFS transporter, SP family, sugar:H+ symporter